MTNQTQMDKMHSETRELTLQSTKDFDKSKSGLLDPDLLTGKQKIFAVRGPQDNLWRFKYEHGILPQPLKQSFTKFDELYKYGEGYFSRRGILIIGTVDIHDEDSFAVGL